MPDTCTAFPISTLPAILSDEKKALELAAELEDEARRLQNEDYRESFGSPARWEWLHALWTSLAGMSSQVPEEDRLIAVALGLARTSRNAVAGNEDGQGEMIRCAPAIIKVLSVLSAYAYVSDDKYFPLIRAFVQALSNLVTDNFYIVAAILPGLVRTKFDSNVISRLLASEDLKTLFSVVVLLRNSLDANAELACLFAERGPSTSGLSITEAVLRKMGDWFEVEDGPEEGAAFEAGYEFISHLFEADLMSSLFDGLKHPSPTEPISAAQSTLLKLYDAHAQTHPAPTPPTFLVPTAISYMTYISTAMSSALSTSSSTTPSSPFSDVRFGKVYEALVLVLQGLLRVGLAERETQETQIESLASGDGAGEEGKVVTLMKDSGTPGGGVIGRSVELLGLADQIQPRLIRTKPISEIKEVDPEEGPKGFTHLRRDLVRILGLLAYGDTEVQDRVRECGGLEIVLSLCGMDESQPYLREHALFTARCLLVGNVVSQERVKELKPLGVVDEDGKLGDMPERWKSAAA